jgi:hypothetical protein
MIVYPLIVVVVNAVFGSIVLRQYLQRRRPHQLVWTVALALGCLAGAFYVLFLGFGHDAALFKLYYICGGLLMAAYLGLGSIYLHAPRRFADTVAACLVAASIVGIALLISTGTDPGRLDEAARTVGPGTNALLSGPWKVFVAVLNTFGALAVIGGAAYSGWQTVRRGAPINFLWANILIAAGTFLAALAGAAADQGTFAGSFWLVLTSGFVVLFIGFLLTTKAGSRVSLTTPSVASVGTGELK